MEMGMGMGLCVDGDVLYGMGSDGYTWRQSLADASGRAYLLSNWMWMSKWGAK